MDDIFIEDENPANFLGCCDRSEYEILNFFLYIPIEKS